jgi:hypothetical protein
MYVYMHIHQSDYIYCILEVHVVTWSHKKAFRENRLGLKNNYASSNIRHTRVTGQQTPDSSIISYVT